MGARANKAKKKARQEIRSSRPLTQKNAVAGTKPGRWQTESELIYKPDEWYFTKKGIRIEKAAIEIKGTKE